MSLKLKRVFPFNVIQVTVIIAMFVPSVPSSPEFLRTNCKVQIYTSARRRMVEWRYTGMHS